VTEDASTAVVCRPELRWPRPNHKGLESAKPDLQSVFKKPGAYEGRSLACARIPLYGKRFGAFLRRLTGSASGDMKRCRRALGPGEIGGLLVEVGTFVKEPMSGSGQARAKPPR
jgi:hypothetical protein